MGTGTLPVSPSPGPLLDAAFTLSRTANALSNVGNYVQSGFGDRLFAGFAAAERAPVHSLQGCIHFGQHLAFRAEKAPRHLTPMRSQIENKRHRLLRLRQRPGTTYFIDLIVFGVLASSSTPNSIKRRR